MAGLLFLSVFVIAEHDFSLTAAFVYGDTAISASQLLHTDTKQWCYKEALGTPLYETDIKCRVFALPATIATSKIS